MNLLIDPAPDSIEIGGEVYRINCGHRTGILAEQVMLDPDLSNEERFNEIINLLFYSEEDQCVKCPEPSEELVRLLILFLTCNASEKRDAKKEHSNVVKTDSTKIYNWDYDYGLIYAAFLHDYRIDLTTVEDLHWWKFRDLFSGLSSQNRICEIMGYRGVDLSKLKGKQKEEAQRLKNLHALPRGISRTETEKNEAAQKWLLEMAQAGKKRCAQDGGSTG